MNPSYDALLTRKPPILLADWRTRRGRELQQHLREKVPCPHCSRRYDPSVIEVHMPKCLRNPANVAAPVVCSCRVCGARVPYGAATCYEHEIKGNYIHGYI